ncbi:MAG TPA: SusC/RagA family TonB-linked outer membrane protein [Flavobacterium sp.]|uniref:SusC/RagA family TonB-linked outer membrane protein n=1 Tax=Flavobacterium sp. TaxID=239 RepID=UPI002C8CC865|nr:SusC/RagA family TonB-linked outer membrane protein [Flavobacterium sp.]HSD14844.1 SusC/RagA family TonB-linked outer membrane protein [Flavobacterium sp.]
MRSKFKWIFALLLAFSMQFSFAQEKTITGTVTEGGLPLPGVSVVVKGTTRGTQTDMDGNYTIKAKTGEVLVFSFIGMKDSSQTVGASNKMDVGMAAESTTLENVVVTAVGIKKRQDQITSSNQVVKAKELTQAANPNVVQSLAGKVTGLQINTTNNGVNATTRIVLRGNRSISGNNQALVVIDNVVSTASILQAMAPEMIESTNILKGAQGAALYGDMGVNGVIVVTTKRGAKSGKLSVAVNSAIDFEEVYFIPQRQERYGQGWNGEHVSYENGGWGAEMDGVVRPVGLAQADGSYIMSPYSPIKDNIKKFFGTGTILQTGFAISGGDLDNGYVALSANRQNTEFVVDGDELNRNSFIFKGGKRLGKWTVEGNVNYITSKTSQTSPNLFTDLLQTATNIPVERFANSGQDGHWTSYYNNPYWLRDNVRNDNRFDYISGIATLNYELNKNISFTFTPSIQVTQQNARSHTNAWVDLIQVGGGDHNVTSSFDSENRNSRKYYHDFLINFDYDLTKDLNLKANLGNNLQDTYNQYTSVGGDNLTIPGLYNISNVTGEVRRENGYNRQRRFGFFGNVDLSYREFLNLNLTGRNDWNSALHGTETDNYFYPSVGVSFIPTKAFDGLKNNKVLNYAKLYGSWVKVGNSSNILVNEVNDLYVSDAASPYAVGYPFGSLNSFTYDRAPADLKIKPEFMETLEGGLTLGFFDDRLTFDGAYYQTNTTDLITNRSVSRATGFTNVKGNVGEMTTKGYELELGFIPVKTKDLIWENRVGYSHSKSVVDKAAPDAKSVALVNFSGTGVGIFAEEGEEFPLIKGIAYQRDDQGRVIIDPSSGNPVRTTEYVKLGKATPDYIINYNTAVEFKGIRLAAVMDYRTGHQFWAGNKDWLSWSGHLVESAENGRSGFIFPNSSVDTDGDGVYEANTTVVTGGNTYTSYLNYFSNEYRAVQENMVLDATAFKVRELSLSYSLPSKMIDRAGLTSLRFGVNARNPFMVLPKENRNYHDPEQSRSSGNDQGLAATGQYPTTRTFGFNVNLTF